MKISSIHAAAVRDTTPLGRSNTPQADVEIVHMNPMVSSGSHVGEAERFDPPWSEAICVVILDNGVWGVGLTAHAGFVVPIINDYLGPMLVGENVDSVGDIGALWDLMTTVTAAHIGAAGSTSFAVSAVDLALYDALGKHVALPVYELLGGKAHDAIPCYATGMDVEKSAEFGFTAFKIPCPWGERGNAGIAALVEAVERARSIVGQADLMVDCWAVMDVDQAVDVCAALEPYDLGWVEDYINPEDWAGYGEVRRRTGGIRLAAGERWFTVRPFEQQSAAGNVDVVQPDPLWVGGVTPTVRIADVAERNSVDLAIHCGVNDAYGQHLCFALGANTIGEMYIGASTSLVDSYRSTPGMALPVGGKLVPTDAPGFGIEITLDGIEAATA
jgi:L-rhamnonate dehydratase